MKIVNLERIGSVTIYLFIDTPPNLEQKIGSLYRGLSVFIFVFYKSALLFFKHVLSRFTPHLGHYRQCNLKLTIKLPYTRAQFPLSF